MRFAKGAGADVGRFFGLIGSPIVHVPDLLGATSSVLPVIRSPCKPCHALRAEISYLPLFRDKGEIITCPTGLCILWLEKSLWFMMPLRRWDAGGTWVPGHSAGLHDQPGRLLVGGKCKSKSSGVFCEVIPTSWCFGWNNSAAKQGLIVFNLKQILWPFLRMLTFNVKMLRE